LLQSAKESCLKVANLEENFQDSIYLSLGRNSRMKKEIIVRRHDENDTNCSLFSERILSIHLAFPQPQS